MGFHRCLSRDGCLGTPAGGDGPHGHSSSLGACSYTNTLISPHSHLHEPRPPTAPVLGGRQSPTLQPVAAIAGAPPAFATGCAKRPPDSPRKQRSAS